MGLAFWIFSVFGFIGLLFVWDFELRISDFDLLARQGNEQTHKILFAPQAQFAGGSKAEAQFPPKADQPQAEPSLWRARPSIAARSGNSG
jgi:hypothetical protein